MPKSCLDESSPQCLNSWRAHDSTITSIEYIGDSDGTCNGQLLLTASTDCCCRLWTLNGMYIGVFGQNNRWNLNNSKIFQSPYKSKFKTRVLRKNSHKKTIEDEKIEIVSFESESEIENQAVQNKIIDLKYNNNESFKKKNLVSIFLKIFIKV